MRRPACSIMRRTRSGRADRRSNWRRVAPRSSAAGSVAPSRGEREPSRRRSPQPPAASRQPYSRTAVSRQLAVAVAAAAAAAVSELLRRVADAVWTRAAQRRASVLGVGSARARADGACKQTAVPTHSKALAPPRALRTPFTFIFAFFIDATSSITGYSHPASTCGHAAALGSWGLSMLLPCGRAR